MRYVLLGLLLFLSGCVVIDPMDVTKEPVKIVKTELPKITPAELPKIQKSETMERRLIGNYCAGIISDKYDEFFKAAALYGPWDDWCVYKAVAVKESWLQADAVSKVNAKGVMQLLDSTFDDVKRQVGATDIFDPEDNIMAGVWYINWLYNRWSWDREEFECKFNLVLASNNYGVGNMYEAQKKAGGDLCIDENWNLPKETKDYYVKIASLLKEWRDAR